ncbi:MAG: hypothetical protein J5755_05180, partial [Clostridia bacterium]|nr:hypothetical protein [Clostridia bacterium]
SLVVSHTPVESVEVVAPSPKAAGETFGLYAIVTPSYADDNPVSWTLSEGEGVASIEGSRMTLASTADHNDLVGVVATVGGVSSQPKRVEISTIQPTSFSLSADTQTLRREESARITSTVLPQGSTGRVDLSLQSSDYTDRFVSLDGETVTVSEDAPEGSFVLVGRMGSLTETLTFQVVKTPVERVVAVKAGEDNVVRYGEVISLYARVYPTTATYADVTWTVSPEGALEPTEDGYRVVTREEGVEITLTASADGISDSLMLVTHAIEVERVDVEVSDSLAVRVGESRTITATAYPLDATYPEVTLRLVTGGEYAHLEGDEIIFDAIGVGNDEVVVTATAGGIVSRVVFHVVPVPVESIVLTTSDNVTDLRAGETVTFDSVVSPADASFPQVTYRLVEGGELGRMVGNVFEVWETAGRGTAVVVAETSDGMVSNEIAITVVGTMQTLVVNSWASLDNDPTYLDGHTAVGLDLRALPKEAGETVLIVSDDVEYLLLIGPYDGTQASCWTNFYLYFLTTDHVEVCLAGVGIRITSGYTDAVVDFGTQADVTLRMEGDNYLAAGNAYAPYAGALATSGSWSENAHPYGMNGFGGLDGGIALSAYTLTITGAGNLTLVGGDASSGTDGTKGAYETDTDPAARGGDGGYGGDGGRAIYAYSLTYDYEGDLTLYGGSAATGGKGGQGGASGLDGKHGTDGNTPDPVYVVTTTTSRKGSPVVHMGGLVTRKDPRPVSSASAYASALANHYKVNVRIGSNTTTLGGYTITRQTDSGQQLLLLRGLDYALTVFGRNTFAELKACHSSGNTVSFNLCDTIKRTLSSGTVYGVTSTGNSVWFATFEPRKRDYMWSNYYNIMIHEMLHLLTFDMGSTSANPLKSGLPAYNLGYTYTTNEKGVYDPSAGYVGSNSPFLTKYSKNDFNEDISDNLSLLCMLVGPSDLTTATAPLTLKAKYITETYEAYYRNVRIWRRPRWLRFAS